MPYNGHQNWINLVHRTKRHVYNKENNKKAEDRDEGSSCKQGQNKGYYSMSDNTIINISTQF